MVDERALVCGHVAVGKALSVVLVCIAECVFAHWRLETRVGALIRLCGQGLRFRSPWCGARHAHASVHGGSLDEFLLLTAKRPRLIFRALYTGTGLAWRSRPGVSLLR